MSNPPGSDQPREGLLLEQARERLGISQNEAASRAKMSGTRWRQIVDGQASAMTSTRGVRTIARMATAMRVSADQFAELGRDDVADLLRDRTELPTMEALAAELEEVKRSYSDLEARFEEFLNERHGSNRNQGKAG